MDPKHLAQLLPRVLQWAKAQEEFVLQHGTPLASRQLDDARHAGVRDPSRVRILVVDRISMPDDPELAEAARGGQVITEASRAVTIGHGITFARIAGRTENLSCTNSCMSPNVSGVAGWRLLFRNTSVIEMTQRTSPLAHWKGKPVTLPGKSVRGRRERSNRRLTRTGAVC